MSAVWFELRSSLNSTYTYVLSQERRSITFYHALAVITSPCRLNFGTLLDRGKIIYVLFENT